MFIQAVLTAAAMNLLKLVQHSRRIETGAVALVADRIEGFQRAFSRFKSELSVPRCSRTLTYKSSALS